MSMRRWYPSLFAMIAVLILPAVARPGDKTPPTEKKAVVKEAKAKPQKAPHTSKMKRVQKVLADLQESVEKYQYDGLFLGPTDKPVAGLVTFPADKFTESIDEIARIANECQAQMKDRYAAARAYYIEIKAPQAAAFQTCEDGMREVGQLINELRRGATWVSMAGGKQGAQYYVELGRLERTIAKIHGLTAVCARSMDRAELLCTQFESKPPVKKGPSKLTW